MSTTGSRSLESRIERLALRGDLRPPGDVHQAWAQRRDRLLACLFSVSLHLIVFAALFWLHVAPSSLHVPPALSPILVSLVDFSEPKPPGQPSATEVATGVHDDTARQTPPHLAAPTLVPAVASTSTPDNSD